MLSSCLPQWDHCLETVPQLLTVPRSFSPQTDAVIPYLSMEVKMQFQAPLLHFSYSSWNCLPRIWTWWKGPMDSAPKGPLQQGRNQNECLVGQHCTEMWMFGNVNWEVWSCTWLSSFLLFLIYLVVLALKSDTDRHGMKSKLGTSSPLLPVRDEKGPQLSPESPRLHGEVQTENLQQCY